MMSEFELTPLRDDEQESINYGSKVNNMADSQTTERDDQRPRSEVRLISTRMLMKRKHQFCRALLIFLVVLLISVICLLLAFYLNETKKRKHEKTQFLPTHVDVEPIIPKGTIYVRSFRSFLHEKDNRISETVFSNGTTLKLFGIKGFSSNKFKVDSLSVTHSNSDKIRIRFGSRHNLAYVLLGNAAHVDFAWSRDLTNLDIKVYLSSPLKGLDAKSYIFTIKLMEYASVLQIIFRAICGITSEDGFLQHLKKPFCVSYLPLRVTKCGSKNMFDGAFLEGKIKIGNSNVFIPALPWPTEKDNCFTQSMDGGAEPNFYIPLPQGGAENLMCNMATKYFISVCSVIATELPTHKICVNISKQVNQIGEREFDQLANIVYQSCVSVMTSLTLMCLSLESDFTHFSHAHSPFFILSDTTVRNKLCTHSDISLHSPPKSISISVLADCPTEHPITSPDQVIYFNRSVSVGEMIHINCRGPPDITLYQLAHSYTGSGDQLTTLNHNFRMCSKCAYESLVTIRVLDNEVCCQNICNNDNTSICALGRLGLQETYQFVTHSSLYCHNFLEDLASDTSALNAQCAGQCTNHFTVDFKITDFREKEVFYHQPIKCRGSTSQTCNSKFGT